ncbi:MAG: PDZ domain-containing protein, partial [Burkholderiales bacterium]|nr:PDZ domain-containing protein [Burkholderiales bacterium]
LKDGVLITGVLRNGPAARGGVRPGDVVLQVSGQPVHDSGELIAAVAALAPGTRATLQLQRGSQQVQVQVQVAERQAAQDGR